MTREMNRRQALGAFGTVSLGALLAACGGDDGGDSAATATATATPTPVPAQTQTPAGSSELAELFDQSATCTQAVEQAEGPYYFDAEAIRSDIRENREGTRLRLAVRVRSAGECQPIPNAVVDIWHCDAGGVYSGFDAGAGERFLRGTQVTNTDGVVQFVTVYPGWYQGRTVHIHAKVHLDRQTVLTTQLYFDEEVSAKVYAREPYASHGQPDQLNRSDGIFDESLVLTLREEDAGYLGLMTVDVAA
jgi:protocatechuate 3,4-dioxygenase beta subunit